MQPPVTCEAGKYVRAEFKHFVISKKKKKKELAVAQTEQQPWFYKMETNYFHISTIKRK